MKVEDEGRQTDEDARVSNYDSVGCERFQYHQSPNHKETS